MASLFFSSPPPLQPLSSVHIFCRFYLWTCFIHARASATGEALGTVPTSFYRLLVVPIISVPTFHVHVCVYTCVCVCVWTCYENIYSSEAANNTNRIRHHSYAFVLRRFSVRVFFGDDSRARGERSITRAREGGDGEDRTWSTRERVDLKPHRASQGSNQFAQVSCFSREKKKKKNPKRTHTCCWRIIKNK